MAFTYNDPVIFAEYALDVADACHELGLKTVAVTAGYIHAAPRREFFARMDAANVELKAFSEDFYFKLTGSHLQPVLDTLAYIRHETGCWLEITTLLIPGHNDSNAEIEALSRWVPTELGPEVPLHFSAFHPDHRMPEVPATPLSTLVRAREIARQQGLQHVYTGNVHHADGDATDCPCCGTRLIVRDWYAIGHYALTPQGRCPGCDTPVAGRWSTQAGQFGRRRIPVRLA